MYPLTPLDAVTLTRDHDAIIRAVSQFEGGEVRVRSAQYVRGTVHLLPDGGRRTRPQRCLAVGAARVDDSAGWTPRRAEVGAARERGLFQLRSAAVEEPQRRRCRSIRASTPRASTRFAGDNSFEESFAFFRSAEILSDLRYIFQTANRFKHLHLHGRPARPRGVRVRRLGARRSASTPIAGSSG